MDVYSAFAGFADTLTNAYVSFDLLTMSYDMDFDFHPNAYGHTVIADAMSAAYEEAVGSTEEEVPAIADIKVAAIPATEFLVYDTVNLDNMAILVTYDDGEQNALAYGEGSDGRLYDSVSNCYISYSLYSSYDVYEDENGEYYETYDSYSCGERLVYLGTLKVAFYIYDDEWNELGVIFTDTEVTVNSWGTEDLTDVTELTLNETYTSDIAEKGDAVWYCYTPEVSGEYIFYSFNNEQASYIDTYVELYYESDGELVYIDSNDDDGSGSNFLLKSNLVAGLTYYYKTKAYSPYTVGVFDVELTEAKEIKSISVSSLSKTEFAQYIEDFDLSGTVVTVTYTDGTTEDIILGDSSTLDSHGNTIYYNLVVEMGDDDFWWYGYGDILNIDIGTYPVLFYTYDDEWNMISDETQSITVVSADESDAYVTIEILDQEYEANEEIGCSEYSIFAFTPAVTGDYYFTIGTDSGADYDAMDIIVRYLEEYEGETYLAYLEQKQYYNEEDGYSYYSYEYDEDTDQSWKVFALEEGVTYYIYCYYYGTWDENWDLDESLTVTVHMAAYEIGHEHSCDDEVIVWTWSDDYSSATASLRCDRCSYIYETVDATVTSVTTEATTEAEGSVVYTATAVINGKTYTSDPVTVILAKLAESGTDTPGEATTSEVNKTTETTVSTATSGDAEGTASTGGTSTKTDDISTLGYYVILLGAAAVVVLLAKKRVNA